MSSTNTLTIRVCSCDSKDSILSCNVEPYVLPAGLSTGALIAILACIVILLGKKPKKKNHTKVNYVGHIRMITSLVIWGCQYNIPKC